MKSILKAAWEGYSAAAAGTGILLILSIGAVYFSGAVTQEKLAAAVRVLKEGDAPPPAAEPKSLDAAWREFELARRQVQEDQERRKAELEELERLTGGTLTRLEAERANLDKRIADYADAEVAAKEARDSLGAAENSAEMQANLPIFAKMEGAAILSLMKRWENARIVRYLRAMKPTKAAEVLEAMRTDPLFEQDFRLPPEGAPPGTETRAELVMEEFKKVPKTGPAE